jgi:hypothetical protein
MNCRNAERWILKSLNRDLPPGEAGLLEEHLRACPDCRTLRNEYTILRGVLGRLPVPALRPGFAGRVGARLDALTRPASESLWRAWCLRAIPVSLFLIGLFVGGLIFLPGGSADFSQTEAFLLNGTVPQSETPVYFDETKKPEENSMQILFPAAETAAAKKPRP